MDTAMITIAAASIFVTPVMSGSILSQRKPAESSH